MIMYCNASRKIRIFHSGNRIPLLKNVCVSLPGLDRSLLRSDIMNEFNILAHARVGDGENTFSTKILRNSSPRNQSYCYGMSSSRSPLCRECMVEIFANSLRETLNITIISNVACTWSGVSTIIIIFLFTECSPPENPLQSNFNFNFNLFSQSVK